MLSAAPAFAQVRFGFWIRARYPVQRHESKAVNAATMAVDDERFLTGGGISDPRN